MTKNAFTMIELIFVIVVIGVLAAVAVPRFFSVQNEAEDNIAKAFGATLTRTVGHTFWSKSISQGDDGSIKVGNTSTFYGDPISKYVEIPGHFDATTVDFSKCTTQGNSAQPFLQKTSAGEYNVFCRDGNITNAPMFVVSQGGSYQF